jgi:hypothetical protein
MKPETTQMMGLVDKSIKIVIITILYVQEAL